MTQRELSRNAARRLVIIRHAEEVTGNVSIRRRRGRRADQAEVDSFWKKMSTVPESEQCGWLKDKFGVS